MIKTYINNSKYKVRGCQWDGTNHVEIINLNIFDIYFCDNALYLHDFDHEIKIRLGNYLIQDENGKIQIYEKTVFENQFNEI